MKGNKKYREGEIWTDQHVKYECSDGRGKVIGRHISLFHHRQFTVLPGITGCVDEDGMIIELGRDIRVQSVVHRCYKQNNTTFYHRSVLHTGFCYRELHCVCLRFQCPPSKSIRECIDEEKVKGRGTRSVKHRQLIQTHIV